MFIYKHYPTYFKFAFDVSLQRKESTLHLAGMIFLCLRLAWELLLRCSVLWCTCGELERRDLTTLPNVIQVPCRLCLHSIGCSGGSYTGMKCLVGAKGLPKARTAGAWIHHLEHQVTITPAGWEPAFSTARDNQCDRDLARIPRESKSNQCGSFVLLVLGSVNSFRDHLVCTSRSFQVWKYKLKCKLWNIHVNILAFKRK